MKRLIQLLALLLALVLCMPAMAEIDDEDMEYWEEQMWVLVEDIGTRDAESGGAYPG